MDFYSNSKNTIYDKILSTSEGLNLFYRVY